MSYTIEQPNYSKYLRKDFSDSIAIEELNDLIKSIKYLRKRLDLEYKESKEPVRSAIGCFLHDIYKPLYYYLEPLSKNNNLTREDIYEMYVLLSNKEHLWYLVYIGNLLSIIFNVE